MIASVLAVVRVVTWVAVGGWVAPDEEAPIAVPLSIIIGSAVTACCYAVFALLGRLDLALAVDGAIAAAALLSNRRLIARRLRALYTEALDAVHGGRWARALAMGWLVLAWLAATAPPRDADVLRYHLAHIRQIALEGRWTRIVDTAYALPFGWSLTYLPFELLHVSVAAQLLNLMIWLVIVAVLCVALRGRVSLPLGLLTFGLACQPMVFKAVTTAHANVYVMLVMVVVAVLIDRAAGLTPRMAALLGFVAWIGAQSRYQAIGIGAAASLTVIVLAAKRAVGLRALAAATAGGLVAGLLAAPFYLMNLRWFGDPVWPLLVAGDSSAASSADRLANVFAQRTTAPLQLASLPRGLFQLGIDISVFPIPWVVAAAVVAGWGFQRTRRLAAFVTCYLVIWLAVSPVPFPRFIIFLVPLVPLLSADALLRLAARPTHASPLPRPVLRGSVARRCAIGALMTFCIVVAALLLADNRESVRYTLTGDRARYDRGTWFAPVFAWANATTPPDARFLVVVKSGGTYALDRPYRRADPEGSAEMDWAAIPDGEALLERLRAGGFQYVIYEDRDWSPYPAGGAMVRVVHDAAARGLLEPIETFPLQLVNSRLLAHSIPTTVRVFRVPAATDRP